MKIYESSIDEDNHVHASNINKYVGMSAASNTCCGHAGIWCEELQHGWSCVAALHDHTRAYIPTNLRHVDRQQTLTAGAGPDASCCSNHFNFYQVAVTCMHAQEGLQMSVLSLHPSQWISWSPKLESALAGNLGVADQAITALSPAKKYIRHRTATAQGGTTHP